MLLLALGAPIALAGDPIKAADAQALLSRAVEQYLANQGHWAYVETQHVIGFGGKPLGETIQEVDPSKAYAEQIRPVKIEGAPPTPGQIQEYRNRGEWQAKQREKDAQGDPAEAGKAPERRVVIFLGGQMAMPDLAHTAVVSEDGNSVTFGVPFLRQDGSHSPLLDRFKVTVRINRQSGDLEHFAVRQEEPLRIKLIAKLASYEEDADFTVVDPRYPSVMTHDVEKATVSILFVRRVVTADVERSELRHVANYDDRFGVKVGPIRTLKF
jgi:hypothetical protein